MAGPKKTFEVAGRCMISDPLSLTPIMETARARYSGPSRKLVVALDIGTTFSGAAYTFLDPGQVPQIQPVTRQVSPLTLGGTNGDE